MVWIRLLYVVYGDIYNDHLRIALGLDDSVTDDNRVVVKVKAIRNINNKLSLFKNELQHDTEGID